MVDILSQPQYVKSKQLMAFSNKITLFFKPIAFSYNNAVITYVRVCFMIKFFLAVLKIIVLMPKFLREGAVVKVFVHRYGKKLICMWSLMLTIAESFLLKKLNHQHLTWSPLKFQGVDKLHWLLASETIKYWWLSARLQYLQSISNGDTAVLHLATNVAGAIFHFLGGSFQVTRTHLRNYTKCKHMFVYLWNTSAN